VTGRVFLIGAGPGDPELLTLKAARALARADVILIDDLVNRGCLAHARSDATVIEVGKRGGCNLAPQAFINKLLVLYTRQGKTVVRLKGGDPFVFGRGGEELLALRDAGIDVEVVPGVTAGIAAPAALGIPVTLRGGASAVTFLTGHTHSGAEPDWEALVRSGATLVIYMGLMNLKKIISRLESSGMKPDTPACVIENATLPCQRHVVSALGRLSDEVLEKNLDTPALVIVGEVVRFTQIKILENAKAA
jgi:uroporphyrin-III C-methyltransferase